MQKTVCPLQWTFGLTYYLFVGFNVNDPMDQQILLELLDDEELEKEYEDIEIQLKMIQMWK